MNKWLDDLCTDWRNTRPVYRGIYALAIGLLLGGIAITGVQPFTAAVMYGAATLLIISMWPEWNRLKALRKSGQGAQRAPGASAESAPRGPTASAGRK